MNISQGMYYQAWNTFFEILSSDMFLRCVLIVFQGIIPPPLAGSLPQNKPGV